LTRRRGTLELRTATAFDCRQTRSKALIAPPKPPEVPRIGLDFSLAVPIISGGWFDDLVSVADGSIGFLML
jgi:hypothetical protein